MVATTAHRQCLDRTSGPAALDVRATRGAVLVQVAVMLVGLTAMSAFIVDYGVMWIARRQIQNAADAAAMAAAISLAFDAPGDLPRARANARATSAQNPVWGAPASMTDADITFPPCPTNGVGRGTCIRVQAFRERATGNAIPTAFAGLAGVRDQGVRATATAQVLFGDATDCVRPIAIPDRWIDTTPGGTPGWDPSDTFDPAGDSYLPPSGDANGSGYARAGTPGDFGRRVNFEPQRIFTDPVGNERYMPIRVTPGARGTSDMIRDFTTCAATVIRPGDELEVEPIDARMPLEVGLDTLIAQDAAASWNPSLNGGRGGISGGCMATAACTVSPRVIPIVAFDTGHWARRPGSPYVIATRVIGLFIESHGTYRPHAFTARMMSYPAAPRSSMTANPASAFVVSVALVR